MSRSTPFSTFLVLALAAATAGAAAAEGNGLVVVDSARPVGDTADRLVEAVEGKGMRVFARIDHAAGAEGAGLTLAPMEVVIFGNPEVGTKLMQCDPRVGLDLPLRALIWQDDAGAVHLAYNDVEWLSARYNLADCAAVLDKVGKALGGFAAAAAE